MIKKLLPSTFLKFFLVSRDLDVSRKRILGLFLTFIILGFSLESLSAKVFAQETPEESAKKYNISFPINELGNCTDFSECRQYCEDPVNANSCIDFAKKKGFHKEEDARKTELIAKAKSSLGCDSESTCREICSIEANFDKCNSFARQNNLSGGHSDEIGKTEVIQKAKSVLGCNSEATCREVCSKEENREKCSNFAKQAGLRGGEHRNGPGGCTSEETCKAFCQDPNNYKVCAGFASSQGGNFSGPGGCNSESTCRQYCEKNSDSCRSFGNQQGYSPEEMCQKTPNCTWANNTCSCGNYSGQAAPTGSYYGGDYCKTNPDKCQQNSSQTPSGTYSQPNSGSGNSANECSSKGCYWVSGQNFCDCQNKPYQSSENECKSGGCTWTGSSCDCSARDSQQQQSYQAPDPATACSYQTGCSWNGSSCQCGGVQGVKTNNSPLQRILDLIKFW